jgi:hypothetical protein
MSAPISAGYPLANPTPLLAQQAAPPAQPQGDPKVRETFDDFVGQTFYGQMLSAMRKTLGKPAYFHGGRGEEVFQGQLDQILAERLSEASADQFTGPMFELFSLQQR